MYRSVGLFHSALATLPDVLDLDHALSDGGLPALPERAEALVRRVQAPARLAAHLRAVHAAALDLADRLGDRFPGLAYDREAVLFGAAIHDIGKTVHVEELSGPGSAHEMEGYRLLLSLDVEERLARFARTHAAWDGPGVVVEDLLVALADKVWKAKRVTELEDLVVERLVAATRREAWEVFSCLDEILFAIAGRADDRLAFQSRYPISS